MSEEPKSSKKKGLLIDSNKLLSLAAIFISAATMFILIYQTSLATKQFDLAQRHQVASVMPYLIIYNSNTDKEFSINIRNHGLGPAFVEKVNVVYKDSVYQQMDLPKFYRKILKPNGYTSTTFYTGGLIEGYVFPANEDFTHIRFKLDTLSGNINTDIINTGEVALEIIYASVFGEKWVIRGLMSKPSKLE